MSRYFAKAGHVSRNSDRPSAWFEATNQPMLPGLSVDDHVPVDTGLVDQRGDPIMRSPNPMGFGRDGEW